MRRRTPLPPPPAIFSQTSSYVAVKTSKRTKDPSLDGIQLVNRSKDLRVISSLLSIMMTASPDGAVPVSAVSKLNRTLETPCRVAAFLRRYPSVFREFVGPLHNLPWFKPSPRASALYSEEQLLFQTHREDLANRVVRLIAMSKEKRLPLQILKGMQWYLGLPLDFNLEKIHDFSEGQLRVVTIDENKAVIAPNLEETVLLSAIQRRGDGSDIKFPLFPSKGVRLKRKVISWLEEFQRIPYVSPYEDPSGLNPGSRIAEKRVAGVLHEILSLFVDHSAERRKLLCLREHLSLPHRFYRALEHHPHIFYLLLKNKTCTVVLKEPYLGPGIEPHPLFDLRSKFVELMMESDRILRDRRSRGRSSELIRSGD